MRHFIPILFSFILVTPAFSGDEVDTAANCKNVRVDVQGGSLEHVPNNNQDQNGTCYAHSAAQLFDAWRFKYSDKNFTKHSSGLFNAYMFSLVYPGKGIDGGWQCGVVYLNALFGSCEEEYIQKAFSSSSATIEQRIANLKDAYNKYRESVGAAQVKAYEEFRKEKQAEYERQQEERAKNPFYIEPMKQDETDLRGVRERQENGVINARAGMAAASAQSAIIENALYKENEYNPPGAKNSTFNQMKNAFENSTNEKELLANFMKLQCPTTHRIYSKNKPACIDAAFGIGKLTRQIDVSLVSKYSLPVGISYCAQVLNEGPKAKYVQHYGKVINIPDQEKCHQHAAIVVGRRWNKKKTRCEYLIRNTWAGSTSPCDYPDYETSFENAGCWVDRKSLNQNLYDLSILE